MIRTLIFLIMIAATLFAGYRLPHYQALDLFAILLTMLGGIFVGMAIVGSRAARIISEVIFALVLLTCTLFGMWKWAWLIPSGFIIAGLWTVLRQSLRLGLRLDPWLAALLALYCWFVAAYILLRFFW